MSAVIRPDAISQYTVGQEPLGGCRVGGGFVGGGLDEPDPDTDVRRILAVLDAWSPDVSFPVALTV